MDLISRNSLDEFSPEHYVAILSQVAHSDGLDAEEQAILEQYASRFDVDLNALPDVPADLANVSWSTRILVYRMPACFRWQMDRIRRLRRHISPIWRTDWCYRKASPNPSGCGFATMGISLNGSMVC